MAHLELATHIATGRAGAWPGRLARALSGADQERAAANVDAAEAELLRIAPSSYVRGQLPSLRARVTRELPLGDARRASVEQIALQPELSRSEREALVAALHAANVEARRQATRVRSFRNVLVWLASTLLALAVGLAVVGVIEAGALPVCFEFPNAAACPTRVAIGGFDPIARAATGWDILIIEAVGMVGGAIGAVLALRSALKLSTPYSLAVALAAVRLPMGALTAVMGIVLMRSSFIPGIGSLQRPEEIIGWAAVWGIAQQIITRPLDRLAPGFAGTAPTAAGPSGTGGPTAGDIDRAVATSLHARLAGPTLINFHGAVSVTVRGAERSDEGDARFLVAPETAPTVAVTIGPDAESGAVSAPLIVEEGDDAPTVPFVVTVDGDRLERRIEHGIEVADAGDARTLEFTLDLHLEEEPSPVWVRVTQQGRLLQLVGVELARSR